MFSSCVAGMKDEYDMIEKGDKCEDFSKDVKIELFQQDTQLLQLC